VAWLPVANTTINNKKLNKMQQHNLLLMMMMMMMMMMILFVWQPIGWTSLEIMQSNAHTKITK